MKAMIKNNEVTNADVAIAEKYFGPDIATIKGRATRYRSAPVVNSLTEIPDKLIETQKDVSLSIDGMTVNGLKFLTTISHEIFYQTSQYVPHAVADVYTENMEEIYNLYKRSGFTMTNVHCDNEFHASMDPYAASKNPPIQMHYVAAQEHVPRVEHTC
jgi:hypothetical protein